jgi:hypothetical protein
VSGEPLLNARMGSGTLTADGRLTSDPERTTCIGLYANRPEAIDEMLEPCNDARPLVLRMGCGIEYRFNSASQVPRQTTMCLCGRPRCILIEVKPAVWEQAP